MLNDRKEYVIHIRNLKQALNYGLVLKRVYGIIKFNQEAWLKPYIDLNTELKKNAKNEFEKYFFRLMNDAVFEKITDNLRKYRNIKLATAEGRRN